MQVPYKTPGFIFTGICLFFGSLVFAQNEEDTFVWDGGANSQDGFKYKHNWNPNEAPDSDGTANLIFSGSVRTSPDAETFNANSVTFNNLAAAFTIVGESLTLQGTGVEYALVNDDLDTQTINTDLVVGADQSWIARDGNLLLGGTSLELGSNALTLDGDFDFDIANNINGNGSLIKDGGGTATLTGTSTYSGGTTINQGVLAGDTDSLQGDISNASTLVFDQGFSGTYGGVVSGTGIMKKQGSGTVTLTGANAYSGDTEIEDGTLQLGGSGVLGDSTLVNLADTSGTTFDVNDQTETIGNLSGGGGSGGNVTLGSGSLTIGANNGDATYSGEISGTGSISKMGSGTLVLGGANTYSGGTTVTEGTLKGDTTGLQGNISNNASLQFQMDSEGAFGDVISGSGDVIKTGSGELTLSGNNTYTGQTRIESGKLILGASGVLSDSTKVHLANTTGVLWDLNGHSETVGSLSGGGVNGGNVELSSGGALVAGSDNSSTEFGGNMNGSGSFSKHGTGKLTFTGTNTYTGGTTVSGGRLVGDTDSLTGSITNNSELEFDQGSVGTFDGTVSGSGDLIKSGGGELTISNSQVYSGETIVSQGSLKLGGKDRLSSTGDLTVNPGTRLSLNGFSQEVGILTFDDGRIDFGETSGANAFLFSDDGSFNGTLTVENWEENLDVFGFSHGSSVDADFINNIYFSGIGSGVLSETDQSVSGYSGTWDLIKPDDTPFATWDGGGSDDKWSTAENWENDAVPTGGTSLKVAFDGSTRTTSVLDSDYTINALRFNETADAFTLDSGPGGKDDLTFDGAVPSMIQKSPNDQTINVNLVLNKTLTSDVTGGGDLYLNGDISGSGGINKIGADQLVLDGANTFSGNLNVSEGNLIVKHDDALGSATSGTSVASGSSLVLEGGVTIAGEALSLEGTLTDTTGDNEYGGAISGDGNVDKAGTGSLTLSGSSANSYSGDTNINQGILVLSKTAGIDAVVGDIYIGNGNGTDTLRLDADNQINDSSRVTLNEGGAPVFDLNSNSEVIGSLSSNNPDASVDLGNSGSLTTGGNGESNAYEGIIIGGGSLNKRGDGGLTLSGSSTYDGTTTVEEGTLTVAHDNALGSASSGTTVESSGTLDLSGGITVSDEAVTVDGTLTDSSGNNNYSGVISGSGTIDKSGNGELTIGGSSANTFSGTTEINQGTIALAKSSGTTALGGNINIGDGSGTDTLRLDSSNQISDTANLDFNSSGLPVFDMNDNSETVGSISSSNTGSSIDLGSGTLTTGGNGNTTTFSGEISGTGDFVKKGSGTLTLDNNNTYTGNTTIEGGVVNLEANDVFNAATDLTIKSNARLNLNGDFSQEIASFSYDDGLLDFGTEGNANHFLVSVDGTQNGSLTINNWTENADIFGVSVDSVDQEFLNNIYFDGLGVGIGAELRESKTNVSGYGEYFEIQPIETFVWDGGVDGTGGGQGDVLWDNDDNWEGDIGPGEAADKAIVMAGQVGNSNDMNGAYVIRSLLFRDDADPFTISSGTNDTLTVNGGGVYNADDDVQTLNVIVKLGANQTWNAYAGNLQFTGNEVLIDNSNLTVTGAYDTTITSDINNGSGSIFKYGEGTLSMGGNNAYTGTTTVNNGTLEVTSDNALGELGSGTTVHDGSTLQLNGSGLNISEGVSVTGTGHDSSGALRNTGGDNTFSGSLSLTGDTTMAAASGTELDITGDVSGSAAITINDSGTIRFSGDNSYTGDTTISSGTLAVDAGSGTAIQGGTIKVESGGTLLLDDSNRIDSSTDLVLDGGSFQLNGHDATMNSLTLSADSTIDFGGGDANLEFLNGAVGDWEDFTLTITNWEGQSSGGDAMLFGAEGISEGQAQQIVFVDPGTQGSGEYPGKIIEDGEVVPTPEPATWLIGGLLGLVVLGHGWNRLRSRDCR